MQYTMPCNTYQKRRKNRTPPPKKKTQNTFRAKTYSQGGGERKEKKGCFVLSFLFGVSLPPTIKLIMASRQDKKINQQKLRRK